MFYFTTERCETPNHTSSHVGHLVLPLIDCSAQASGRQSAWDAPVDARQFWDLASNIDDAAKLEPDDAVSLLLFIMSAGD